MLAFLYNFVTLLQNTTYMINSNFTIYWSSHLHVDDVQVEF